MELGRPSLVKGIVTQGRHVNPRTLCCIQRVTQYKVMWSKDGVNWNTIQDQQGNDLVSIMQLIENCYLFKNNRRSELWSMQSDKFEKSQIK